MSIPIPLVVLVCLLFTVFMIVIHYFIQLFLNVSSERDRYKRGYENLSSRPTYTYFELLEEVLKSAQPPLSKVDSEIQKLVNLAIDPHANYNEASNAAMQACKRLARKG